MGVVAVEPEFWRGRRVFITGHSGFKGGWLTTWLLEMGADVTGYALAPDTQPSYFDLCGLGERMTSIEGDICDDPSLRGVVMAAHPDIIFHLAAQSLVRRGYVEPLKTFATNVIGTANLLEACRKTSSVRAVVLVTSDKCYDLTVAGRALREADPLGGQDPYSASKACTEIVANAYRSSFFDGEAPVAIATVRAGNVIGGGDWAEDRLVPDAVRALQRSSTLIIRNARAVRPWQHVLEPLSGYLMLAQRLYEEGGRWAGAWNFGPTESDMVEVAELADKLTESWGSGAWQSSASCEGMREAPVLRLDSSKAMQVLGWRPRWNLDQAVKMTIGWYRQVLLEGASQPYAISRAQIADYTEACV